LGTFSVNLDKKEQSEEKKESINFDNCGNTAAEINCRQVEKFPAENKFTDLRWHI
jgi:hypothetical protein